MNVSQMSFAALLLFGLLLTACKKPDFATEVGNGTFNWDQLEQRSNEGLSPNTYLGDKPLLNYAAFIGRADAVEVLLRNGADFRLGTRSLGRPALFEAAYSGNIKIATLLLDAGLDPNVKDITGTTPLRNAAIGKRPKMVEFLISRGADPKSRDRQGLSVSEQMKDGTTPEIMALLRVP